MIRPAHLSNFLSGQYEGFTYDRATTVHIKFARAFLATEFGRDHLIFLTVDSMAAGVATETPGGGVW